MMISKEQLLHKGFVCKQSTYGSYYVYGNFGLAGNIKWQLCNPESGEPLSTLLYIETMEDVEKIINHGL